MRSRISSAVAEAAEIVTTRLGPPDLGVVLGSGFTELTRGLNAEASMPAGLLPGWPRGGTAGHEGTIHAARVGDARFWVFDGRLHLYEGWDVGQVVLPATMLAAAGAHGVLMTCAAGGLSDESGPGDLVLVDDHINLTGTDPVRVIPSRAQRDMFVDFQNVYDRSYREGWRAAARERGVTLRAGVLAALPGPSYETPAEVSMLKTIGADLVSMSTVPEVMAAHALGLRVAAVACVANRGAGLDLDSPIRHDDVLTTVQTSVMRHTDFFLCGLRKMVRSGPVPPGAPDTSGR